MKSFILALLMTAPCYADDITIAGPFSGINDTDSSITLDASEAQDTLNVEVSQDLMALTKRNGFVLDATLAIATSPVLGAAYFKSSAGNNIRLVAHDRYVSASSNGGEYSHIITSATVGAKWSFCASAGIIFAFNSEHDIPWSYNGTAITYYPSMPRASLCAMTVDRMLLAGTTDFPNRLYFSQSGAITNFTVDINPEDPGFEDIGLSGDKITSIFATQAEWLVFKTNSFTSYQGSNQFDLLPSVISEKVGMIDPHAIIQHEGIVYFKATDGKIWAYNSGTITELSKKIRNFVNGITKDATISKLYTTKADFDSGTYYNSTGSVTAGSVEPYPFVNEDTTDNDFNAGDITSSITVSNNAITMPAFIDGEYPNIGGELGNTSNWTGSLSTNTVPANVGFGNYSLYWTHGISSAFVGCIEIKDINGNQLYVQGLTAAAQTTVLDVSLYTTPIQVIFGEYTSGCTARATSKIFNRSNSLSFFTHIGCFSGCTSSKAYFDIVENGPNISSATFISQVHTTTAPNPHYGYLTSTKTIPSGTQIDFFVRHSSASDGVFTDWAATTDYILLSSTDTAWQYKANLYNNSSYLPPSIESVGLLFKSTGYWETPEVDMQSMSTWGTFSVDASTTGTGAWSYAIYVSTFQGGTATASPQTVTNGATITASTGTFSKVRATNIFYTTTETVRLNNLSYSWNTASNKMGHAFEYRGDIYFSVPYNYSTTNNRLLKLDTKSNGWQIFDLAINEPLTLDDYIYFGSPTSGFLYQYPVGDSDNGAAINSYWKTKNYIGTNPYVEKKFKKISTILGSDYGSSLDVTYTMDTATSTTYTISLTSTTSDFVRNNRALPFGDSGAVFNLQIGNNAENQPWSFYGANVEYSNDPWRVTEE